MRSDLNNGIVAGLLGGVVYGRANPDTADLKVPFLLVRSHHATG